MGSRIEREKVKRIIRMLRKVVRMNKGKENEVKNYCKRRAF